MIGIILAILVIPLVYYLARYLNGPKYPGPSLLEIYRQMNPSKLHQVMTTFADKYGPVFQFSLPANKLLVVSGYAEIHEVLVTRGKDFSGRPQRFRQLHISDGGRSIVFNSRQKPWRTLRKVASSHMKQYGSGMDALEELFQAMGEAMIQSMLDTKGEAFDPLDLIYRAAFNSIHILVTGQEADEKRFRIIRNYENNVTRTVLSAQGMLLDAFPFIRHFGNKTYRDLEELKRMRNEIWEKLKEELPFMEDGNMTQVLVNAIAGSHADGDEVTDADVKNTIMTLFTAGIATTTRSFYAFMNLCLNHEEVLTKLRGEVDTVVGPSRYPSLKDRPEMPYTRAAIFELLRYASVAPLGVPHMSVVDTSVGVFPVPKGTVVSLNVWSLHHDDKFWGDPWAFRPERFLTESLDDVVPADHPNRKHLFPFGGGPRVCLGENMALARLFLWTAALVQRVEFVPETNNNPVSSDCRNFVFGAALFPTKYRIRTSARSAD